MSWVRYIEVRITPFSKMYPDTLPIHEVNITVRTSAERIELREYVPDAEFKSRFRWMLERIESEVAARVGVAKIDQPNVQTF